MHDAYLVGVAGMLFIVAGWALAPRDPPPARLSTLYMAGSSLLALYAYMIGDPLFLALNILATILALYNLAKRLRCKQGNQRD